MLPFRRWFANVEGSVRAMTAMPRSRRRGPLLTAVVLAILCCATSATIALAAGDPAITASGGNDFSDSAPVTVSAVVATFMDPESAALAGDYSATIDWGDGSINTAGTVGGDSSSGFTVSGNHDYVTHGSFTITVTITDVDNPANTATVTDSAEISGVGPVLIPGPPAVQGSSEAAFTGTVNPTGLPTTAHFEYGLDRRYRAAGGTSVYDQSTPEQSVGSDSTNHTVAATVTGLVPNALYHERMVATNSAGTTVGFDQTFMTKQDPTPPAPVLGKSFDATPVSGVVFIKPPRGKSLRALGTQFSRDALRKGHGFVPLTETRQLPFGSRVDARHGSLMVITASAHPGKTQQGVFSRGLFKAAAQKRTGRSKGLTTLSLLEGAFPGAPSYASCKVHATSDSGFSAHAARLSRRVLQTLHSRVHGAFRAHGHFSAGTVRGTVWDTTDRCDGTLTVVHRGTVLVRDFRLRKTIAVHAGHSYLARALARRA